MEQIRETFPAQEIWERLSPEETFAGPWELFRHKQQAEFLHQLLCQSDVEIQLTSRGSSDEGQALHVLRFGTGERKVFIWARQHGDESDCTAGLAMALREILLRPKDPCYAEMLEKLTFVVMPMVNPDGVTQFKRRNAQDIDVNRDAIAEATPEGRALIRLKDEFQPEISFNLHDMSARKADEEGRLVALAFQACPFGPDEEDDEPRRKAKRVVGRMVDAVSDLAENGIARYTADYMPKAFGDNMARWGSGTILIEAGGWYADRGGDNYVRRLFALALLRGLYAVAAGEDLEGNVDTYDQIPFDKGKAFYDQIIEGTDVLTGSGRPPYRADLAINRDLLIGPRSCRLEWYAGIENIGDLELERAKERISLPDHLLLPGLVAVAPAFRFRDDMPTFEQAESFLRAGITTVVCGFGPFASNRARDQWMGLSKENPPPLNIVAYERISSLRELWGRHGMSALSGFLLQDLEVSADDLMRMMHLFHPSEPMPLGADETGYTVAVDMFFQPAPSMRDVRLHLHLSPVTRQKGLTLVRRSDLRLLVDEFLVTPEQITFTVDALETPLTWLPLLLGYGGLSDGREPEPHFFGSILKHYAAQTMPAVMAAHNMLSITVSKAFRIGSYGKIALGKRADLVAFQKPLVEGENSNYERILPSMVMLNGVRILEDNAFYSKEGNGNWHFASEQKDR